MSKRKYAHNVVLHSPLTGCYYFCPKVEVLDGGIRRVAGRKVDVTESMRELFGPMLNREAKRLESATREKAAK